MQWSWHPGCLSGSPSSRRAWIEILLYSTLLCRLFVALLAEGVDRNSVDQAAIIRMTTSPSSRRAWIEMVKFLLALHI